VAEGEGVQFALAHDTQCRAGNTIDGDVEFDASAGLGTASPRRPSETLLCGRRWSHATATLSAMGWKRSLRIATAADFSQARVDGLGWRGGGFVALGVVQTQAGRRQAALIPGQPPS